VYQVRPEGTVLGTARINDIVLQDPVLAVRNINRQKSVALLTYGIWRWRLMVQNDPATAGHLDRFLFNTVRWLTTREDDRPVQVSTTKDFYNQGEPVEFVAQVYDATARPVENAELRVTVGSGEQSLAATLTHVGNGRFEGELHGLPEGSFSYTGVAARASEMLGSDKGRFSVGEQNLEFRDTRMNASLLRQLAGRTGGRFFMPAELDSLNEVLGSHPSFTGREVEHRLTLELWNWPWTLAIALMAFAVEWLVRKVVGLV
jgi:hypothetical protein